MSIELTEVRRLMYRCQVVEVGRNALAEAHSIMAECYGTLGALLAERERLTARLDSALTVCRCAVRVIESSAYQGVSDEDCDLESAVKNWKAGKP